MWVMPSLISSTTGTFPEIDAFSKIVSFVLECAGRRWVRFNSDKVCAITYARIQGKVALMAKFRRSR